VLSTAQFEAAPIGCECHWAVQASRNVLNDRRSMEAEAILSPILVQHSGIWAQKVVANR
jgi:hypothetical protein